LEKPVKADRERKEQLAYFSADTMKTLCW